MLRKKGSEEACQMRELDFLSVSGMDWCGSP